MPRTSITIIMTDELKEAIKEAAYRDRLPFSLWCRAVLAREVDKQEEVEG